MKNQFISIPVDSFETITKCLTPEKVGKLVSVMLDDAKKTGAVRYKDSDLLFFLAVTVNDRPADAELEKPAEENDAVQEDSTEPSENHEQ